MNDSIPLGALPDLLVVSGIPGAGKSTFCKWLATEHAYSHVEADKAEDSALHSALALGDRLRLAQVVGSMRREGVRTTIDWNLPPSRIKTVQRLRDAGASIWWFDGDREAAAESVLRRGNASIPAFESQLLEIERAWLDIRATFAGRIVRVVTAGPSYMAPEAILAKIRARSQ